MTQENERMTTQQALDEVLAEMEAMTPEQLREELNKHKDGPLATALRETSEFLGRYQQEKENASSTNQSPAQ